MVPGAAFAAVGRAVDRPDDLDGLVALEHQRNQRAAGDEVAQWRVEVPLDVLEVVRVGLSAVDQPLLQDHDGEALGLEPGDNTSPTRPRRTASGLIRTRVR